MIGRSYFYSRAKHRLAMCGTWSHVLSLHQQHMVARLTLSNNTKQSSCFKEAITPLSDIATHLVSFQ